MKRLRSRSTSARAILLVLFTLSLLCGVLVAPVVGVGSGSHQVESVSELGTDLGDPTGSPTTFSVDTDLESATGVVGVVVSLTDAEIPEGGPPETVQAALEEHAEVTQEAVLVYADETEGVTVRNRFWLTNAVLLEVDLEVVDLESFGAFEAVETVHTNFDVHAHESPVSETSVSGTSSRETRVVGGGSGGAVGAVSAPGAAVTVGTGGPVEATDTSTLSSVATTDGVSKINATEVWDVYDTRGEGVTVAVLDTGIDVEHPDISLYTTDSSDETYPGGWAEFDSSGDEIVGSTPYDHGSHGTHVSGTVAGGNASGSWIGVAPGADVLHGSVLGPDGGTFASVISGMQWAVENDADVVSMSLGPADGGYVDGMITPIRNTESAGVVVVASVGNDGEGTSGTPGNSYDSIGVGAIDATDEVPSFSGGEVIVTDDAWSDPPNDWPDEYVTPEVVAPGVGVESAVPGGGYESLSGTSMAAPHVAGAVALFRAVHEDATPADTKEALYGTAWKPDGAPTQQDTRYGHGIVDIRAAVDGYAPATLEGEVVDQNDDPVDGATVSVDGAHTATASDGSYELAVDAGERTVAVDAAGYEGVNDDLTVPSDRTVTHDVTLERYLTVSLLEDVPATVESTGNASVSAQFEVHNADTVTVSLAENATVDPGSLELTLEEEPVALEEDVEIESHTADDPLTAEVRLENGTDGTLELAFAFADSDVEEVVHAGPTEVVPLVYDVGVIAPGDDTDESNAATEWLRTDLEERLPAAYRVEHVDASEAIGAVEEYDAFVALEFADEATVEEFSQEAATQGVGVLYLGSERSSDALVQFQNVTGTPSSLVHDGQEGNATETVSLVADRTHPLLEGVVLERESVDVLENASVRTWFEGGEGAGGDDSGGSGETDGLETVASVTADGVLADGGGLALNRSNRQVLFALTPRDGELTESGSEIVANAVEYLGPGALYVAEDFETYGVAGEPETVVFNVPEEGRVTVSLTDETSVDESTLTLTVDGETIDAGDELSVDADHVTDGLAVTVDADATTEGAVQLALEADTDTGGSETVTTAVLTVEENPPARYEGTVAVNGVPAGNGLTVRAVVDGETVASTPVDGGWFGVGDTSSGDGPGSESGPLEVDADPEDEVEFVLENASTSDSFSWSAGDERRVALSVTYDDPFANTSLVAPAWALESEPTTVSVSMDGNESVLRSVDWEGESVQGQTTTGSNTSLTFETLGESTLTVTASTLGGETHTLEHTLYVTDRPAIDVSGTLEGVVGNDTHVRIDPEPAEWADVTPVGTDGTFTGLGLEGAFHHVTLLEEPSEDGDDRWAIGTLVYDDLEGDVDLGALTVPAWHDLSVVVTDDDETPVENATVAVAPVSDTSRHHHSLTGTTDEHGEFVPDESALAGLRTNGTVTVTVLPPTDDFEDELIVETDVVESETIVDVTLETVADDGGSSGGGGGGFGGGGFGGGLDSGDDLEPTFTVVDGSVFPLEAHPGETVTAEATVENTGDGAGEETVVLRADGDRLGSTSVSLEPGERETISLTFSLETSATITLEGNVLGTVTVLEEADDEPQFDTENDSETETGNGALTEERASPESNVTDEGSEDEPSGEATGADSSTDTSDRGSNGQSSIGEDSVPGFGVVPALVALVALSCSHLWRRKRRQ